MSSQGLALNFGIIISSPELHLIFHGTKGHCAFGLLFACLGVSGPQVAYKAVHNGKGQ